MFNALKKMAGLIRPESHGGSLESALKVIERHNYRAHLYLPSTGVQDDPELCEALELMKLAGYIVTKPCGQLVGKIASIGRPVDHEILSEI